LTRVTFTNPEGITFSPEFYENIKINEDMDQKVRDFSLSLTVFDERELKLMSAGTEVFIEYGEGLTFRGIIENNPKTLDRFKRKYEISGKDKLFRTQAILVNESYEDMLISDIVLDLLTKYPVQDISIGNIQTTQFRTSVRFKSTYLYTALERLADAVNFTFRLDEDERFNFFEKSVNQSNLSIKNGMFNAGSASFATDSSQLVNKLYAYGGNALSEDITQTIIGDGSNSTYLLNYKPRASSSGKVDIFINGAAVSTGIVGLNDSDAVEALINYNEKNVKFQYPDTKEDRILIIDEEATVTYRVETPIMTIIQSPESIAKFGIREGMVRFPDISEKSALVERAREHLNRYSFPITSGSLSSWRNDWNVSELVKVEIEVEEGFFINEYLQITGKSIELTPGKIQVSYDFEVKKQLVNILKDILARLEELEKQSEDEIVEQITDMRDTAQTVDFVAILNEINRPFRIGRSRIGEAI
jgi:hypothetical protein